MALSNFSDNMDIIQALADQPALSASAMKIEFDKAGNKLKTWINSTLVPFINGLVDGSNLGTKVVKTANIDDEAVTSAKIADANVTSAKLAAQTKIVLSGSDIYGNSLPASGTTGQIFFLYVGN